VGSVVGAGIVTGVPSGLVTGTPPGVVTGIPLAVVDDPGLVVAERGAVPTDSDDPFGVAVLDATVVGL
jgi:hypothetical protein